MEGCRYQRQLRYEAVRAACFPKLPYRCLKRMFDRDSCVACPVIIWQVRDHPRCDPEPPHAGTPVIHRYPSACLNDGVWAEVLGGAAGGRL